MKRINYRSLAFQHYHDRLFCAHCGFGIPAVLEVAHLDGRRENNDVRNLVLLCPTCHKMLDLDLYFQRDDAPDAGPAKGGSLVQADEGRGAEGGAKPQAPRDGATTQEAIGGSEGCRHAEAQRKQKDQQCNRQPRWLTVGSRRSMTAVTATNTGLRGLVTALLTAAALTARGAMSPLDPGFTVRSWGIEDGLPEAPINALARTPDGYLWLGTSAGLVRFDGTRFVTLTTNTTPALGDDRILSLLADTNGVLWIGTQTGTLARRQARTFVQVPPDPRLRGVPINSLKPAREGGFWLATGGRGLVRFKDGACDFSTPTNGLWQADVTSVVREEPNCLWVVSGARLRALQQDRWQLAPGGPDKATPTGSAAPREGDPAWIATASENPLWDGADRLFQFARLQSFQELAPYAWSQDPQHSSIQSVLGDHKGRMWVGTASDGVFFWTPGAGWQRITSEVVQTGGRVPVMMEDAEGLIWMAGSRGTLYQVREGLVAPLRLSADEAGTRTLSVCAAPDGNVWVGTDGAGVFRFANGALTQFTNGLASLHVYSVLVDRRTNLWAGTLNGLCRWEKTGFIQCALPVPLTPKLSALYEDRRGNLWAGTSGGLVRISPEGATTLFPKTAGLDDFDFISLAEDTQGRLWAGVRDHGLYRLVGERFEALGSARWPGSLSIRSLLADADGALWITTQGAGLFRLKDEVFRQWTQQDGLPQMYLNGIIEDGRGNLWFSSENGIFGCPKAALLADRSARNGPLLFWHLSVEDGMDSKACSGRAQPVLARSADGHLWVPNGRALAVFDPAKVSRPGCTLAPIAEEVAADGVLCQPGVAGRFRLRSDARRVEFHYTCPDLRSAGPLRFQYRLDGSDLEWTDAGAQHVAYYGQLPPGDYRFRVMAGSAAGQWREAAEALPLTIVPQWWERTSIRAGGTFSGAVLLGGTVWLLTRARQSRKLARVKLQHARESERVRIARDLHDHLGASLTHVVLQSEMLAGRSTAAEETQRRARTIADAAAETVKSLDEIVWAVSPRNDTLDSLLQYLSQFAGELFNESNLSLTLELPPDPLPIPLSAETRHNVFLAVKEALNNTLKHSRARQVGLRVAVRGAELEIAVSDDGVGGVDAKRLAGQQRDGLPNMQQRLRDLGGSLSIESPPNQGTRITMIVPLQQAVTKT